MVSGAPLHIALDGDDLDGDWLTYSTQTTASGLLATIPKQLTANGNRSLRITVSHHLGTDTPYDDSDDQVLPLGTMEFELFEGRASRATSRIIDLAEAGWYDGKLFHRVISGFMIQGGSKNGLGSSGIGVTFDDQFDPTLQHTGEGLLSMANSGDDTNDTQFFITATDTRWLDFDHTVFGRLTGGDDVRQLIAGVPTNGDPYYQNGVNIGGTNRPLNDVVIESVEVFYDHEDAVMMLAVAEGLAGEADVTVTVSDGNGGTAEKTIHVVVEADEEDGHPYLKDFDPIFVDFETPLEFWLDAVDVEGDQIFHAGTVTSSSPDGSDPEMVVSSDGHVTITPTDGKYGAYTVEFEVGSASDDMQDSQTVPVFVRPPTPTVELTPESDTGRADNATTVNNGDESLKFVVSGVVVGATAWLEVDGVTVATTEVSREAVFDNGSVTYDILLKLTGDELPDGVYEYQAGQTVALTGDYNGVDLDSVLSDLLPVRIDTMAPEILQDVVPQAIAGEKYRYQVQATDGDNTDIRYSVDGLYAGMEQDAVTGEITWTPDRSQAGLRSLVVLAVDGAGNTGTREFDIRVNAALQIEIEGDTAANEESTLSFRVNAWDDDVPGAIVEISILSTTFPGDANPPTLTKDGDNTAVFEWETREEEGPGVYDVVFRATDDIGSVRDKTFTITVIEVNEAPELTVAYQEWMPEDWLSIAEDEALLLDIAATDHDLPANDLVFSLAGDVPVGASIDEETGEFTWIPSELQGGLDLEMIVRVSDSGGLSDEVTVKIAVEEVNSPPVFDPVQTETTFAGLDVEIEVNARDPDVPTNTIRYSLVEGEHPEGVVIDAETGKITWDVPRDFMEGHDPNEPVEITVKAEENVPAGEESLSALKTVEVMVVGSIEELLAGAALMNSAEDKPGSSAAKDGAVSPAADGALDPALFLGTPSGESSSGESAGTPLSHMLDVGSNSSSLFAPLIGSGGSSGGGSGQETERANEPEKQEESDNKNDSDEGEADTSEGTNMIVPLDVVSRELNAAAVEEYPGNEELTDESGREADQVSESSREGEQVTAEDEALMICVEELVAAVAEKETAGS